MKVNKGADKSRHEVKHPREKGGEALRAGIEHLHEHHKENRREAPERPEHRRKGA